MSEWSSIRGALLKDAADYEEFQSILITAMMAGMWVCVRKTNAPRSVQSGGPNNHRGPPAETVRVILTLYNLTGSWSALSRAPLLVSAEQPRHRGNIFNAWKAAERNGKAGGNLTSAVTSCRRAFVASLAVSDARHFQVIALNLLMQMLAAILPDRKRCVSSFG